MKTKSWNFGLLAALALLAAGCSAVDGLIIHPLSVLHRQHEYNEKARVDAAYSWDPLKTNDFAAECKSAPTNGPSRTGQGGYEILK